MKIEYILKTFLLTTVAALSFMTVAQTKPVKLKVISENKGPVIDHKNQDVIDSKNKSGFETGQVVKLNGVYHMFVNEMFDRPHRDMRIAHWTSPDAVSWKRQGAVVNSIPNRTPTNPRSEVWVTGVEFNEDENAWNIFYVAYRGGDESKGEAPGSDYDGRIWRAKSVVPGMEGIAGPYADMGIIMEPDENTQYWEGEQAVATFNPYKVGKMWYAMYDGHNYNPKTGWPSGLANAPKLEGPWTRLPLGINPLNIVDEFMENPQITELKDGRYLTVFDSFGDQEIGYSISTDGVNWSKEARIRIQNGNNIWGDAGDHAMRTPLCVIEEENGTFTVVYTSLTTKSGERFYAIGKCNLAWEK